MAFMLILTILILVICRVHSNRNDPIYRTRCNHPGRTIHHHGLQNVALYDLDMLLGPRNTENPDVNQGG